MLAGFIERVEEVARHLDPALAVECTALADSSDPVRGIVMIRVPVSPLAPHQANGRYYGRDERHVYQLSDAEVARLMRQREHLDDHLLQVLRTPPASTL